MILILKCWLAALKSIAVDILKVIAATWNSNKHPMSKKYDASILLTK